MPSDVIEARLPGGLWQDGACRREAAVRPLSGADELFVCASAGRSLAERTTALLARCVVALGAQSPVDPDQLRRLSVGDREALVLQLRAGTFGDAVECVFTCPDPACGEPLELELATEELLVEPYAELAQQHEGEVTLAGAVRTIRFRVPTGRDQEELAGSAAELDAAVAELFRRCVEWGDEDGVPAELVEQVDALMEQADPQAWLVLALECPECGARFSVPFDAAAYLLAELEARAPRLDREIHVLASRYHWSEREILRLTAPRRQRYLELINDELAAARST